MITVSVFIQLEIVNALPVVPTISIEMADKQLTEVNAMLDSCKQLIDKHTATLDEVAQQQSTGTEPEISEKEQQKLKAVVVFAQQTLSCLRDTADSLRNALLHVDDLQIKIKDTVKKLKHACRSQFSVPAELVYVRLILLIRVYLRNMLHLA